jgi:hypothetical protein
VLTLLHFVSNVHAASFGLIVHLPLYKLLLYCRSLQGNGYSRWLFSAGTVQPCMCSILRSCWLNVLLFRPAAVIDVFVLLKKVNSLCGLVVTDPGYRREMFCVSCEVWTKFICCVKESRPPLRSSGNSSWLQKGDVLCFVWGRTEFIYVM